MNVFDLQAVLSLDTSKYDQGLQGAGAKAKSFGATLKGGLVTGAKVAGAAVAAVGAATVAAGAVITKATGQVAQYGDAIDKESQKLGISAKAYQEWDAVLQHTGGSINNLKPAMKTLSKEIVNNSDAFQQLGISQEELLTSSKEEVFSKVITKLQGMEDGVERTRLAQQLLGRSSIELGALLNTSAEDTQKMKDRVNELGGVMSDEAVKASAAYEDSLQDLTTAMDGIKRNAIAKFLPSMVDVMDGLTSIFAGEEGGVEKVEKGIDGIIKTVEETAPKFADTAIKIGGALFQAIIQNLPKITQNLVKFLVQAIAGLVDSIPTLADAGIKILTSLMNTIWEEVPKLFKGLGESLDTLIPELLESALKLIAELAEGLAENGDDMVDSGMGLMEHLIEGIINAIPILIEYAPRIVSALALAIIRMAPKILIAGIKLTLALLSGIVKTIPQVGSGIIKGLNAAIRAISSIDWLQVGIDIINGIAGGITSAGGTLINALVNAAKNALQAAKNFLGIHSPSTRFRKEVGEQIPEGAALGVRDNTQAVVDAVRDMDEALVAPYSENSFAGYEEPEEELETEVSMLGNDTTGGEHAQKDITVILQLDKTQLAKTVFKLNNEETQRIGLQLAGGRA